MIVLLLLVIAACHSTSQVNGQCTISKCKETASESDQRILDRIDEHDQELQTKYRYLYSAFEKLAREQNENDQNLQQALQNFSFIVQKNEKTLMKGLEDQGKMMRTAYNSSSVQEMLGRKSQNDSHCLKTENYENHLKITNSNTSSRINESICAIKEDLLINLEGLQEKIKAVCQNTSTRFDRIDERFLESEKKNDENIEIILRNLEIMHQNFSKRLTILDDKFDHIVGHEMEHDQRLQAMEVKLSSAIVRINERLNAVLDHINKGFENLKFQDYCRSSSAVCDCSDIKANGYIESGLYRISVEHQQMRYFANAYCDMTTANDSWTVFQRRKDGSEDFYRGWNDYANGFGNASEEFWLGNDFIHLLTSKRTYRLRIDLEDFEGQKRYAEYSTFNISSATYNYTLSIGNYSGDAEDGLGYQGYPSKNHIDRQFSTKDADNDEDIPRHCAVIYSGAWWYNSCYISNLNGIYKRGSYSDCTACGIVWWLWRGAQYSLKTTEMKISPAV